MMFARKTFPAAPAIADRTPAPDTAERMANAIIDALRMAIIMAPVIFSLPQFAS